MTTETVASTTRRLTQPGGGSASPRWLLYVLGTGFATASSFLALSGPVFLSKILKPPNRPNLLRWRQVGSRSAHLGNRPSLLPRAPCTECPPSPAASSGLCPAQRSLCPHLKMGLMLNAPRCWAPGGSLGTLQGGHRLVRIFLPLEQRMEDRRDFSVG